MTEYADVLKIVIAVAAMFLLSLIQYSVNISKKNRARQTLMVPISVLISLILIVVGQHYFKSLYTEQPNVPVSGQTEIGSEVDTGAETEENSDALDALDDEDDEDDVYTYIASEVDAEATNNDLTDNTEPKATEPVPAAQPETEQGSSYFADTDIILANVLLMAIFLAVKGLVCLILRRLADNRIFIANTASTFYYYDDKDYCEWFLKEKWANFRSYFLAGAIGVVIVAGVWMGLTWYSGRESVWWYPAFPITAIIIVNEFFSFINGETKEELEFEVMGSAASAEKISNFNRVHQIFKQTLPDALLFAHSGCDFVNRESPRSDVEALADSGVRAEAAAAKYFGSDERWKKVGMDEYKATIELVNGRSVVFFNPFYRDLSVCLTLPIINTLLKGRKCLVVTGRSTISEDVKEWLSEMISDFSKMKSLWRVSELNEEGRPCEVGILGFPNLYDNRLMTANLEFFRDTEFVVFLEPSRIIGTAQIAISILSNAVYADGKKPVYCICDRNSDGLVDTMSHVLQTEITTVVAPPVPRCMYTCMCWDADGEFKRQSMFDKQTKYLGNGVEIAALAIKNQIPEVNWYCESKAPIKDIKWIAGKYYAALCKFMHIPSQQKSLYERLKFVSNPWLAPKKKENFIIAEDEFCNMFNALQTYLSRGETQSFVNILSENYLLRDYMRCNKQMFVTNPDAIPSVVPDYAKTERNVLFKLLIEMSFRQVSEREVLDEFHLIGIQKTDAMEILTEMLTKYTNADNSVLNVECHQVEADSLATITESYFSIDLTTFEKYFSHSLKTAFFVIEDESRVDAYVDAKLYGQVTQTLLPGQYITYDGKYYCAKTISPQSGVVLRRASDLYDGRKYYRQIRKYSVLSMKKENILKKLTISDIEISFIPADFRVDTDGYLEMNDVKNLKDSKVISFAGDPSAKYYAREYRNKTVMRIKFPRDPEENEDPHMYKCILFTFCMLLQELFRTVFPSTWQYIAAVTKASESIGGILNYMMYPCDGEVEDGYIYIIEDSDMDLGLIGAFERNLDGFFSIIADFLDWHFEKLREPPAEDPIPENIKVERREKREKQNLFVRTLRRIRRLIGIDREEEINPEERGISEPELLREGEEHIPAGEEVRGEGHTPAEETGEDSGAVVPDNEPRFEMLDTHPEKDENRQAEEDSAESGNNSTADAAEIRRRVYAEEDHIPGLDDDPLLADPDGTDIFEESRINTDPELLNQFELYNEFFNRSVNTKYQLECFLKFGYEEIDPRVKLKEVRDYLRVRGWCNNEFTKARRLDILGADELTLETESYCDFCSAPLTSVSYEKLNDGRIRCNECSVSAITSLEGFRGMFRQVVETMQAFYDIRIKVPVGLKVTDAETLSKGRRYLFKSSGSTGSSSLGYAKKKFGKYSIDIENGSPRLVAIETIVHELTHIWQKTNWSEAKILKEYGSGNKTMIYEGMATWASIQYMYMIGEAYYANKQEQYMLHRNADDELRRGFENYCRKYPLVKNSSFVTRSPFMVDFPF